jgi:phage tail-like protein
MAEIPINAAFFAVEFQGKLKGYFREMSGLGSENEITQQRATDAKGNVVWFQLPGNLKFSPVTLKQGITTGSDSLSLWTWRKEIEQGKYESAKANGSIIMLNQERKEVARWEFIGAWPSKITGPAPNASSNDVAIEEMQLCYDEYKRTK